MSSIKLSLNRKGPLQRIPDSHAITDDKPDTNSKIGRFVGVDAYRKAGGTITADLFAKEQYFESQQSSGLNPFKRKFWVSTLLNKRIVMFAPIVNASCGDLNTPTCAVPTPPL